MAGLSSRALGRTTLARQHLIEPVPFAGAASALDLVTHLVGMQAQHPQSFYTGLFSRMTGFTPDGAAQVGELLTSGELVRMAVMRSTIHLCTPADALAWRTSAQPVFDKEMRQVVRHRALAGVDLAALARRAIELLAPEPLTMAALGAELAQDFPGRPVESLGYAARNSLPVFQAPPRGVWGKAGATRLQLLPGGAPAAGLEERWFGERGPGSLPLGAAADGGEIRDLIRRYLAAFGPASVQDVQRFTGLVRLAEITDQMRDLVRLKGQDTSRELLDIDGAALPDEDTPVPARLLYDYDNVLLSHDDRSRVIDPEVSARWPVVDNGVQHPAILLDGRTAGYWALVRQGRGKPEDPAALVLTPLRKLRTGERPALRAEARRLLAFLAPGAGERTVSFAVGN